MIRLGIAVPVAVLLSLVMAQFSCRRGQPDTLPPDLARCTHLEIEWPRGILNCFIGDTAIRQSILSEEEKHLIRSLDPYVVRDSEAIKALAHVLDQGVYLGRLRGQLGWGAPVHVSCYSGGDYLTTFTIYGETVVFEDRRRFKYETYVSELSTVEPVEVQPFKLRYECALHLGRLYGSIFFSHRQAAKYPAPSTWADAIVEALRREYVIDAAVDGRTRRANTDRNIARMFTCPSVREGACEPNRPRETNESDAFAYEPPSIVSHYAMNPACEPNSPANTVLLFEARAGWNQHGGPELFTFENHDPRGGCVLLNDGTVRFIRTEEELQQLRWN